MMQVVADPDQDRCPGAFARCSPHRSVLTKTQDMEAVYIPDSITDDDALAVGPERNRHRCTFQRYHGSADSFFEIPEPERAVPGA